MAHVKASIGEAAYAVTIQAGRHALAADEGPGLGGQDTAPGPYELVLAGLGACTAITLKMYAQRKAWPLAHVHVTLHLHRDESSARVERLIAVEGELSDEQRARLADIAERTPVTLTLKGGLPIHTTLAAAAPGAAP